MGRIDQGKITEEDSWDSLNGNLRKVKKGSVGVFEFLDV